MVVSGFAGLTFLTKNSFLDQINQQYVMTARAKGSFRKKSIIWSCFSQCHVHSYCWLSLHAFIGILFSSSLFIEVIFSLGWTWDYLVMKLLYQEIIL